MKRGFLAALLGALVLFTVACKSKADENEAIRQGVVKHLAALNMLNMSNMDVKITQATINGNQAQARVEIRSKGGDPNAAPMQIGYALEKQGNEWVVLKSTGMGGGMQHPGPGDAPSGSAPGAMPPGHPNVSGGAGQSSTGHSDFNAILNNAQGSSSQQPQPQTQAPPASTKP
jgi:hypothetical protein